jgi:hypothetical protein
MIYNESAISNSPTNGACDHLLGDVSVAAANNARAMHMLIAVIDATYKRFATTPDFAHTLRAPASDNCKHRPFVMHATTSWRKVVAEMFE